MSSSRWSRHSEVAVDGHRTWSPTSQGRTSGVGLMSEAMAQRRTVEREGRARRINAPVRRSPRAGSMPDLLMAFAFGGWAMAIVLVGGSFFDDAIVAGEAGPALARLFAASVAFASLLVFLLGVAMLRERRAIGLRIAFAFVVGALGGSLETLLLLNAPGVWMLAPVALVALVIRPVRERIFLTLRLVPQGDGLS